MSAADAPSFDLQSHSDHSDGTLAPHDVVIAAAAAGVQLLALSDHDTTAGVSQASAAADEVGIGLVSAVEMTAACGQRHDLHVLGYLIDPDHRELEAALAHSRADRERRAGRMGDALRELGFELDETMLGQRTARGQAIGRPHLAQAVVGRQENRARLQTEGVTDPTDFLVAYLIDGKPAFRAREAPSVPEAISLIHAAGGVAVWAHPFWDIPDSAEVLTAIDRFREAGLDGVEAFYVAHTEEQTRFLQQRCSELGLLTTGSSDFHGPEHRTFSRFRAFSTYGLTPLLGPLVA